MDDHPEVGYVFCPGFGLLENEETGLLTYSCHGDDDTIFDGQKFLSKLMCGNSVVAASGMVRKQLYDRYGGFPLDLPYAGDWYLWCLFALHSDVGYFAEPMVNYREHQLSITNSIMEDREHAWKAEGIAIAWRIKRAVEETGHDWLVAHCDESLVRQYASSLGRYGMTPAEFEQSLRDYDASPESSEFIRRRSYLPAGDHALSSGDRSRAAMLYALAIKCSPTDMEALFKFILLHLGKAGDKIREGIGAVRRGIQSNA
jgi:hypothetical protein